MLKGDGKKLERGVRGEMIGHKGGNEGRQKWVWYVTRRAK